MTFVGFTQIMKNKKRSEICERIKREKVYELATWLFFFFLAHFNINNNWIKTIERKGKKKKKKVCLCVCMCVSATLNYVVECDSLCFLADTTLFYLFIYLFLLLLVLGWSLLPIGLRWFIPFWHSSFFSQFHVAHPSL